MPTKMLIHVGPGAMPSASESTEDGGSGATIAVDRQAVMRAAQQSKAAQRKAQQEEEERKRYSVITIYLSVCITM